MKHSARLIGSSLYCIVLVLSIANHEGYISTEQAIVFRARTAVPLQFSIQRLGIDAPIEAVGVLDDGKMAVPVQAEHVGWYEYGPRPGDTGSAVLAGHVNWTGGKDAVFTPLHTIQIGDIVQVQNSIGGTDTFAVRTIKEYPTNSDATEVFSSSDGSSWLNLITCDGTWDPILKTHRSRLVVFTEKI